MVGNTSQRCLTAGISLHLRLHGSTVVFQAAVNGCAGGPKAVRCMVAGRALTCMSSSAQSAAGLGLFEYMQLAEELGAEPVWVINNGVAHADSNPHDRHPALGAGGI